MTRGSRLQLPYDDAVPVNGHGVHARAMCSKHAVAAWITRILDVDRIPLIDQYARAQVQRLLRTADDEHLCRRALDRA